jgi:hypothetical protein
MDLAIIPECYVDTSLIESIAPPRQGGYNHQKGCGTVAEVMKERFSDAFALGIVDKDKRTIDYLHEFVIVCNIDSLTLHKHKTRHHYIIQIDPAIERFILKSAQTAGISLRDFGLPDDLSSLTKISKTVNSKKDIKFKSLFRALIESQSSEIIRLSSWIRYLKENNYGANPDAVKDL